MFFPSRPLLLAIGAYAVLLSWLGAVEAAVTVDSTVLIISPDEASAYSAWSPLRGYGIPYEILIVPKEGVQLPTLNSTAESGNYGGIVIIADVTYQYEDYSTSALTQPQWRQMFSYQTHFGVRMVRWGVWPTTEFGVTALGGTSENQQISISNDTSFKTANLKTGPSAGMDTTGLYHNPAKISDPSMAWEIAQFAAGDGYPVSTAAVINSIKGRQQMVWFLPFATDWSATSNFLAHAWVQWMTRGLYLGFRRLYLSTQVDDMFLATPMYKPKDLDFRIVPEDLDAHVTWQKDINKRMPSGSKFIIEIGHNGNGQIETASDLDRYRYCDPPEGIDYPEQIDTPLEFKKPLGTGEDIWPATPEEYMWESECLELDDLGNWFADKNNLNAFAHISHTFTHEVLNNATFDDTYKEITWNQQWLANTGISEAKLFSPEGLIPPGITGLHNGDAIRAWVEGGIKYVVGDNTRPAIRNPDNEWWPLITTVEQNGYEGLYIIGRWATTMFYNCDLPDCTTQEWIDTSGGKGTFTDLLNDARSTNTRHLLGLHWDPFMFHQANMRVHDVPRTTINGKSGRYSLLQSWTEVVVQEMIRLVDWPMITLKHDDIVKAWINRMTRDQCNPRLKYDISEDRTKIIGFEVSAGDNDQCSTPIPVTVPKLPSSTDGSTVEQVGHDIPTLWVNMDGAAYNYAFDTPISVSA
ncbi:hypothetical protein M501DRAFT_1006822 [Patellaria atrata CBS 101060]|uniref:Extracellular serine-rich protein n=1 Tax=Patellaria atrata CBS 101060 TaxID=1346257 RepID=A0A9P4S739_9PEZI|nr:hypothetical protein M501DRAFT_1006822 [Patellaria atrata CBS 101060]